MQQAEKKGSFEELQPSFDKTSSEVIEKCVLDIWQRVLDSTDIDYQMDFFALGGDSFLLLQMLVQVSHAMKPLGRDFDSDEFFESITAYANKTTNTSQTKGTLSISNLVTYISNQDISTQFTVSAPPAQSTSLTNIWDAPLSYAQESLWFLEQLEAQTTAYNETALLEVYGPFVLSVFEASVHTIMQRHALLRTSFQIIDDTPREIIAPILPVPLVIVDLQAFAGSEQSAELSALQIRSAQAPFDFAQAPLFRIMVIQKGPEEYVVCLTIHHIIVDGWSLDVLWQELSALYRAGVEKQSLELEPLPLQYTDYVQWQRQWLSSDESERQRSYWEKQLQGMPAQLSLPTYKPRSSKQSFQGASYFFKLSSELSQQVMLLSRQESVSLFMTLLAAFQLLLLRYSQQEDICIGTPIANRRLPGTERLIGMFANTVILRCNLSGNSSFRQLLRRVREVCLEGYAYQEFPFEKIVEMLQPQRHLSHNPLFQVMFTLQKTSLSGPDLLGLEVHAVEMEVVAAKFDLSLLVSETEDRLACRWEYSTDLFEQETITRMAQHYEVILTGIVRDLDCPIERLPLLTTEDEHILVEMWNNSSHTYPQQYWCLPQLFEAQAQDTPDAIAALFEDSFLSYRDLDLRANQLAHALRLLGVGPDVRVGVFMERSLELVVALLGILKAGGAYVPLDPGYPVERLVFIAQDAAIQVLLTQQKIHAQLPDLPCQQVIELDREWDRMTHLATHALNSAIVADNIAYIIYTSGSTGQPKGAMNTHAAITNRLLWMQRTYQLNEQDRVLQKTPYSFDVSVWEFFWPLLTGACLVLAKPEGHKDSSYLVELIASEKITTLHFVPPMLTVFLEEPGLTVCTSLKRVFCSGEALPYETQERFFKCLRAELHNLYGPTEAAVDVSFWACHLGEEKQIVPIGRPIDNIQLYILDQCLNLVPIGAAGELYIGGIGLARGYMEKPDLTSEKFIPNPFRPAAGTRLYRTGDLARYRPGGEIEFLGRIDHQVKIRGFRIELGEVEVVLSEHPAVQEAVVIVRDDLSQEKELVAYIVPKDAEMAPSTSIYRRYLQENLPHYMVPSYMVLLENFPLSGNGKIDRRALPVPERPQNEKDEQPIAPRTLLEEQLATIWRRVLGDVQISIHDNFFNLGGHSLLATQLISRIRSELQIEIPLHTLFENPTIAGLAQRVEQITREKQDLQVPPLLPATRGQYAPLSFAQQRLWFLDHLEPESIAYLIPSALQLHGPLDVQALVWSLQELVRRHESLRTTFAEHEGLPVQVIHPVETVRVPVVDLSSLGQQEREWETQLLIEQEMLQPCDLTRGPLLRMVLLRLNSEKHVLLFTLHHIVSDAWSDEILQRELAVLYRAAIAGQPSPLPPLPVQYADFAIWQRNWLQGEMLEQQLAYWKLQLAGAPAALELPTDRPRPAIQTFQGASRDFTLSQQQSDGLKRLSLEERATLFMTLLASFQVLLSRYSGQEDIVVGTPIANRRRTEIEPLIGFFVNTLVLRTGLHGNPTFRELVRRVREVALGAYSHQDVPFEQIVDAVQPARDLSRSPLFQVMFTLQNAETAPVIMPDISIQPLQIGNKVAKFDLTIFLREHSDSIQGSLEYNTTLFDGDTIERMIACYQYLLDQILANPEQHVSAFSLVSAAERQLQLEVWNATQVDYPQGMAIHNLFEAQVACIPEAIALVYYDEHLTYEMVDRRANQLASYLRSQGVGPDVAVGLCLDRTPFLLLGILGIWKAGGAYVPIDTTLPQERILSILQDAQLSLVLTQGSALDHFSTFAGSVLNLEQAWPHIATDDLEYPALPLSPENLAYIIYTSGSTGQPKGVAVEHRNVSNYLHWIDKELFEASTFNVPVLTRPGFDASLKQLFAPLLRGNAVWLLGQDVGENPTQFIQSLVTRTHLAINCVPSLWKVILDLLQTHQMSHYSTHFTDLLIGGETLQHNLVERTLTLFPHLRIHNLYGPTEATANASCARITSPDGITLGGPIANAQLYILDRFLQPIPIGVPGELCLAGPGIARGYLSRPDLTAECFLPHPFSIEPGARLYRSGDKARYLPNGDIEYLGRLDHQVKIRGFRIELGEIESVLQQHSLVQDCAVLLCDNVLGEQQLVAYVVAKEISPLLPNDLRRALTTHLPLYMVPSAFVQVEKLPMSPNGKLDRQTLAALPLPNGTRSAQIQEPRTPLEGIIAGIWSQVLGREQIDIDHNFFDLGGHSLLAVTLVNQIKGRLQQVIPLTAFFRNATIRSLAELLHESEQTLGTETSALVPVQPQGTEAPLFFVHPVGGEVFCYKDLAALMGTDHPFYGLRFPFNEGTRQVSVHMEDLVAHYIDAVRSVQAQGPYILGGWSLGGTIAYAMAEQLRGWGDEVSALVLLDSYAPATFVNEKNDIQLLLDMITDLVSTTGYALPDLVHQPGFSESFSHQLEQLSPQERLRFIWEQCQKWHLLPNTLTLSQLQHLFFTFKTNVMTMRRYVPEKNNQRVLLFKPEQEIDTIEDVTNGWSSLVNGSLEMYTLPANHYTLLKQPCVALLAEQLKAAL